MTNGHDWIMRPVLAQMCRYESLKDCTLDIDDVADMNEALDVRYENEARIEDARRRKEASKSKR